SEGSGSIVLELARATSVEEVIVESGGARPVTVTVVEAPAARSPRGQLTPWPATVQVVGVAPTGATPVSIESLTTTPTPVLGAVVVTARVEVTSAPAIAGSGVVVLVIDRSAFAATGVSVRLPT